MNTNASGIRISKVKHREEWRIRVDFSYDSAKVTLLRQIEGARWSRTLRHSFATHLLENGTDLRYIQNL